MYSKKLKGYIGYSHRASYTFKIGDVLFEQDWKPKNENDKKYKKYYKINKYNKNNSKKNYKIIINFNFIISDFRFPSLLHFFLYVIYLFIFMYSYFILLTLV